MKHIDYTHLVDTIAAMVIEANRLLAPDAVQALRQARDAEESELAGGILDCCLENLNIAERESLPVCQDTGTAVFFVTMGVEVVLAGGRSPLVQDAIADGVEKGYREGYLRKSILSDPLFDRKNTGTNLPPVIHFEQCAGDLLEIHCAPKGGGAENMSRMVMLSPSAGVAGVREFVVRSVLEAGGNPCPPVILGVWHRRQF
jgi:fumarate hydratase subunit alpha